MAGSFFGINVARSGLAAQKLAMEVVSENIANANDASYTRQRVVSSTGESIAMTQESTATGTSTITNGLRTGSIERVTDTLVTNQLRQTNTSSEQWEYTYNMLSQIETVFDEPNDDGLQTDLNNFWSAWQEVATTPDSISMRSTLIDNTEALTSRIQYTYNQIRSVQTDINGSIDDIVDRVNNISQEIATLNQRIATLPSGEMQSNELLDQRDALVLELSGYASVTQNGESGGDFVLSIGGQVLVQGNQYNTIESSTDDSGNQVIEWSKNGRDLSIKGGQLKSMLDLTNTTIPEYLSQLNSLASTLIEQVNSLHATGKTLDGSDGGEFFVSGGDAGSITLNSDLASNPSLIAASKDGNVGDGEIARDIGSLQNTTLSSGLTINGMYQALIGDVSGDTHAAEQQSTVASLSLEEYTTLQQSISGVSMDEEMTNIIKFQQAYNASSRVLTVMNEMLDTLINRTGNS